MSMWCVCVCAYVIFRDIAKISSIRFIPLCNTWLCLFNHTLTMSFVQLLKVFLIWQMLTCSKCHLDFYFPNYELLWHLLNLFPLLHWSTADAPYICYRHTTQWFPNFKGYTPFYDYGKIFAKSPVLCSISLWLNFYLIVCTSYCLNLIFSLLPSLSLQGANDLFSLFLSLLLFCYVH